MFRFAAILHGIRGRVLRGTAVERRGRAGAIFENSRCRVAELAWAQALKTA